MCVYSTLSHNKLEHMLMAPQRRVHVGNKFWDVWNKFSDRIKLFKFQNMIWDFKLIKMDFSRDKSFGHDFCPRFQVLLQKQHLKCGKSQLFITFYLCTARPRNMWPLGARTLPIHSFNWVQTFSSYTDFRHFSPGFSSNFLGFLTILLAHDARF